MNPLIAALCGSVMVMICGVGSWLLATATSNSRMKSLEETNRALKKRIAEMRSIEEIEKRMKAMEDQADRIGEGQARLDQSLVNLAKVITGEMALSTPGGTQIGQNAMAGVRRSYSEIDPQEGLPPGIGEAI
jgi:hypothetical protein